MDLRPFEIMGERVRLEPIDRSHVAGLVTAANEDRSTYRYTWVPPSADGMRRYVDAALADQARGRSLVWTVWDRGQGRIVGTTRYLDMQVFTWPPPWPPGVDLGPLPTAAAPPTVLEIGSTWYGASAQQSGVNAECKYLLLAWAFEQWKTLRVTLKTDARNDRSRGSIERLGARFEGLRLRHTPASDGSIRDSAYYAILAEDWPAVRQDLLLRLGRT